MDRYLTIAFDFLSGAWKWLLVCFAIAALAFVKGCDHGQTIERAAQARATEKARDLAERSAGAAAQEREADRQVTAQAQEGRDNAIQNANDTGRPSAASNALNCERLRQAGRDVSQFPACGGRAPGAAADTGR